MDLLIAITRPFFFVSIFCCSIAVILLVKIQKLKTTRNLIHTNLIIAIGIKALYDIIWRPIHHYSYKYLYSDNFTYDLMQYIIDNYPGQCEPTHELLSEANSKAFDYFHHFATCKVFYVIGQYVEISLTFWILVEALYLHSLIFVIFFNEKEILKKYLMLGWLLPIFITLIFLSVNLVNDPGFCWDSLETPANGRVAQRPCLMFVKISKTHSKSLSRIPNFLKFFMAFCLVGLLSVHILTEIWRKVKQTEYNNQMQIKQAHITALCRSAAVLFPLVCIHKVVLIFVPISPDNEKIIYQFLYYFRLYFETIFNSFQGILISYLYCFQTQEVKEEFNRFINIRKVHGWYGARRNSAYNYAQARRGSIVSQVSARTSATEFRTSTFKSPS